MGMQYNDIIRQLESNIKDGKVIFNTDDRLINQELKTLQVEKDELDTRMMLENKKFIKNGSECYENKINISSFYGIMDESRGVSNAGMVDKVFGKSSR